MNSFFANLENNIFDIRLIPVVHVTYRIPSREIIIWLRNKLWATIYGRSVNIVFGNTLGDGNNSHEGSCFVSYKRSLSCKRQFSCRSIKANRNLRKLHFWLLCVFVDSDNTEMLKLAQRVAFWIVFCLFSSSRTIGNLRPKMRKIFVFVI